MSLVSTLAIVAIVLAGYAAVTFGYAAANPVLSPDRKVRNSNLRDCAISVAALVAGLFIYLTN